MRRTLIEGPHLLEEALSLGADLDHVFAKESDAVTSRLAVRSGVPLHRVTDAAMARLSGTSSPRGPVAVLQIPDPTPPSGGSVLVAWGVSDPGNMGSLVRIAAGFGWALGHSPGASDPWAPKVVRSGAGGHFRTTIWRIDHLTDLRPRRLIASVPRGGVSPRHLEVAGPVAVLVGDEGSGLPAEVVSACDDVVTIEMPGGTESLNAAVAAGILVYELTPDR
jgi:TrmH family RNA methyltransferase